MQMAEEVRPAFWSFSDIRTSLRYGRAFVQKATSDDTRVHEDSGRRSCLPLIGVQLLDHTPCSNQEGFYRIATVGRGPGVRTYFEQDLVGLWYTYGIVKHKRCPL